MAEDEIWHGGDLAGIAARFPHAPQPWIDLSTGINPNAYPLVEAPSVSWQRLPGKADEAALLQAARQAYRVPDRAGLVAAPGTQILIDLLPRLVPARDVVVLGPTYAEHALAWRKAGARLHEATTLDAIGSPDLPLPAIVVVVNPNNPDGRLIAPERLVAVARQMAARDGLLVVDEAFCDFTPGASLLPDLPPATLVLRSFGKTYGLAGLRLGFAAGAPALIQALATALGPWAVSGPALHIGAAALADTAWLAQAQTRAEAEAARLGALLAPLGRVTGETPLYRLLATPSAPALFVHLAEAGVYVRRFQHDPSWLRFGLAGDEESWHRLAEALASFSQGRRQAAPLTSQPHES